ncbi:MAG: DNA-deoxyinosine glycosylase [Clostridia bacterium]|nr:DNA-deoxyinosine glycosylase [Clostridia bacterium]
MAYLEHVTHPFLPIHDGQSRILILGSFPSVKSRETDFYYGHPRNRFWSVLANIFSCDLPGTPEEKTQLILSHRLALWDVIASCDVHASSDASVKNADPVRISDVTDHNPIERVLLNGALAGRLYRQHLLPLCHLPCEVLPSTSAANAAFSLERLCAVWGPALLH